MISPEELFAIAEHGATLFKRATGVKFFPLNILTNTIQNLTLFVTEAL